VRLLLLLVVKKKHKKKHKADLTDTIYIFPISRTFQDLLKKSSTFQGPQLNRTEALFKTTTEIQDLFKIVRTMHHLNECMKTSQSITH